MNKLLSFVDDILKSEVIKLEFVFIYRSSYVLLYLYTVLSFACSHLHVQSNVSADRLKCGSNELWAKQL